MSAAVIPDAMEAYQSRLQDWRTWLDQSLIDVLCPMAYTPDPKQFEAQVALAQDYAGGRPVWMGIGAYRLPSATTLQFIAASKRLGTSGVALFSYDALIAPPYSSSTLTGYRPRGLRRRPALTPRRGRVMSLSALDYAVIGAYLARHHGVRVVVRPLPAHDP